MSIEFVCQVCGRELKADERAIGRKVRCPDCATLLIIPDPNAVEDEEEGTAGPPLPDEPADSVEQTFNQSQKPFPPSRRPQPEEDIGETAPMKLEDLQSLESPPLAPRPPSSPATKRHPDKYRQRPAEAEPRSEHAVPPEAVPPPPARVRVAEANTVPGVTSGAAGATAGLSGSAPPPRRHSTYDDAPLVPRPHPHPEDLIDMTAMVDIVFFLLIFFLVTSLQALESVMNLPTPQSGDPGVATGKSVAELENDPNYITVRIEDDDSIWVENSQVFNDQELAIKLRAARQESDGPRSLLVVADADASHGTAVRVFDAGAGAAVSGISLVVQEKDGGK